MLRSLNNLKIKILAIFTAVLVVFTGIISWKPKKITADAFESISTQDIEYLINVAFEDFEFEFNSGNPVCIFFDGRFITKGGNSAYNVSSIEDLDSVDWTTFIATMETIFQEKLGFPAEEDINAFDEINIRVFMHWQNSQYIDLTYGGIVGFPNVSVLESEDIGISLTDTVFYGLLALDLESTTQSFYRFLINLSNASRYFYGYALDVDGNGNPGMLNATILPSLEDI